MTSDLPEPPVHAPQLGEDRLGAPSREHDAEFSAFYKESAPGLVMFLRAHGASLADAAEITQEAMAQLYKDWPAVRVPKAWAYRVASRRWGRRIADLGPEGLTDGEASTGPRTRLASTDVSVMIEQRHELLRALDGLAPRQRQVLAWTAAGYTPAEIAHELGLTPEAVRSSLYSARRKAAALLGGEA